MSLSLVSYKKMKIHIMASILIATCAGPVMAMPTVNTHNATNITAQSATLNGMANANDFTVMIYFGYGLDTNYGATVAADQNPVTGISDTPVSANITDLTPNTIYHYRAAAIDPSGDVSYGADMTFATEPADIVFADPSCTGADNCFRSIQTAIDSVIQENAYLLISRGVYDEDVVLNGQTKQLIIAGESTDPSRPNEPAWRSLRIQNGHVTLLPMFELGDGGVWVCGTLILSASASKIPKD